MESKADILFYGGSAGSSKTDMIIGLATTEHQNSIIFRREATQLDGIERRMKQLLGSDGFLTQKRTFTIKTDDGIEREIKLGSMQYADDWMNHQGVGRDLMAFDEGSHFLEDQFRIMIGWNRSEDPNQRCRVVIVGNPPTTPEGQWIVGYFGAWLDPKHPKYPTPDGELRFYTTVRGHDIEYPDATPVKIDGEVELVTPRSRTVILATVRDNPHLMDSGYMSVLQGLKEPFRSMMLDGDFTIGMTDDIWQVIPTAWVRAAMDRWTDLNPKPKMDSMGVDVAREGADFTVISRRHGVWFDKLERMEGPLAPDGPAVAGQVITLLRDDAVVHIDAIGIGASPYDFLKDKVQTVACKNSFGTKEKDSTGTMGYKNHRARDWWRMREALEPANNIGLCLPDDSQLMADLCTPTFKMTGQMLIQIEEKEAIKSRLGRSPDDGEAVVMALTNTPKKSKKSKKIVFATEW